MPFEQRYIAGEVVTGFRDRLANMISKNEGIRQFSILTNTAYNADVPFADTQQTRIRITNSQHDISQLDKTYITATFSADVSFSHVTLAANNGGINNPRFKNLYFFLGWKNSNEMIRQLEIENMNVDTGYLQTEASKEGFAYSTFLPEEQRANELFCHSRWEDVSQGKPGVCGTYFMAPAHLNGASLTGNGTLPAANGGHFTITGIRAILYIPQLLGLQSFQDWIGGLGDIVLKLYFNKNSMVYAFVDPNADLLNTTTLLDNNTDDISHTEDGLPLHELSPLRYGFTQVGHPTRWITDWTQAAANAIGEDVTLNVHSLTITKLQCDCFGFNVTQETKRQLYQLFTPMHPLIIPAQQIDIKHFPSNVQAGNYTSDFTYALHNVTDFLLVFPNRSTDVTTFMNPMATGLQLRVDGKLYPNQQFDSTNDYRFYAAMMNAADLDGFIQCNKEYRDSILIPRTATLRNHRTDMTDFICVIEAERNGGGFFFDGLETGNQNVNINLRFTASAVSSGAVNGAAAPANGAPPPQLWFCRDTYWTVDNENGLRYWKTGTPQIYASEEDPYAANAIQ